MGVGGAGGSDWSRGVRPLGLRCSVLLLLLENNCSHLFRFSSFCVRRRRVFPSLFEPNNFSNPKQENHSNKNQQDWAWLNEGFRYKEAGLCRNNSNCLTSGWEGVFTCSKCLECVLSPEPQNCKGLLFPLSQTHRYLEPKKKATTATTTMTSRTPSTTRPATRPVLLEPDPEPEPEPVRQAFLISKPAN